MWTDINGPVPVTEVLRYIKNAALELNTTILLSTLQACNLTWAVTVLYSVYSWGYNAFIFYPCTTFTSPYMLRNCNMFIFNC